MTRDQVGDLLDVGILQDVFLACMDVSGMRRKALAEEAAREGSPSGEAPAG